MFFRLMLFNDDKIMYSIFENKVGTLLGFVVGTIDGFIDGFTDGFEVVGRIVGILLGKIVGTAEGIPGNKNYLNEQINRIKCFFSKDGFAELCKCIE